MDTAVHFGPKLPKWFRKCHIDSYLVHNYSYTPDNYGAFSEVRVGRQSIADLRAAGVTDADINEARRLQSIQRAHGRKAQPLAVIVGLQRPGLPTTDEKIISARMLRKAREAGAAARSLQEIAVSCREADPTRSAQARQAAALAMQVARPFQQYEFDFFGGGNVSIAFQYQDAITERLRDTGVSIAQQQTAKAVLWDICRHLEWQSYECKKNAADLCNITGMKAPNMASTLNLLEDVGAIHRVKRGRVKVITVTPEGAFRGDMNKHHEVQKRYHLEVINGGKVEANDD